MAEQEIHRYGIPINDTDDESITMQIVTMVSSRQRQRRVWMMQFLKKAFGLSRKDASKAIRELGFDDLVCAG